jgi:hypothetical protein
MNSQLTSASGQPPPKPFVISSATANPLTTPKNRYLFRNAGGDTRFATENPIRIGLFRRLAFHTGVVVQPLDHNPTIAILIAMIAILIVAVITCAILW